MPGNTDSDRPSKVMKLRPGDMVWFEADDAVLRELTVISHDAEKRTITGTVTVWRNKSRNSRSTETTTIHERSLSWIGPRRFR